MTVAAHATPKQADFAAALLDPARTVPPGLRAWNGSDPTARLAVYRNNVVVSLVQALADGFPVVQRLVGDEFFAAMAGVYVRAHPPRSPLLAAYGDGFADWIAGFEPAAMLPYLPDMARLEHARVCAFHAADVAPLDAAAIRRRLARAAALDPVRIGVHPSVGVIVSDWAVPSLWAAHQHDDGGHSDDDSDRAIGDVVLDKPESALVLRDADEVLVLPVARADAVFVQALRSAQPLGTAAHAASLAADAEAPFDLSAALSLLIRHHGITGWHSPGDPS